MPVVVSVVATWLAGFLWFRVLFRLPSADGLSPFTASLLQRVGDIGFACLLAWIMVRTGTHTIRDGILLAVMIWLGFVAAVEVTCSRSDLSRSDSLPRRQAVSSSRSSSSARSLAP
jgi:hypothetical protein